MPGESNLSVLLKSMQPKLHEGEYVFCTLPNLDGLTIYKIILFFKEEEGYAVIVRKELADQLNLKYSFVASWISLTVHSSLEAVGLTAAFSTALANQGISCNVVAGYYHDHIFVGTADAEKAIGVLDALK